ncbi:MAG: hypothetical protein G01um101429_50 [Parcubacteria group bacterium Gr01-1014_29]|nr:MAG: hypothetical protein G01um101429_50 [Parcubacteria group bacterium Gr01-1014_29]
MKYNFERIQKNIIPDLLDNISSKNQPLAIENTEYTSE